MHVYTCMAAESEMGTIRIPGRTLPVIRRSAAFAVQP